MKSKKATTLVIRIFCMVLCAAILTATLAGCGLISKDPPGTDSITGNNGKTDEPTEPQDSVTEPGDTEATGSATESETQPEPSESDGSKAEEPTDSATEAPSESITELDTVTDTEKPSESATVTEPTEPSTSTPIIREPTVVDTSKAKYTYDEMCGDLAELASEYSGLFSYYEIGRSADGRSIYAAVLGSGKASKQIISEAGTHGREYINPLFVMATLEYYLKNYDVPLFGAEGQKKTAREILSDTDLYVIPMLNPDGITISQLGVDALRIEALREGVRKIYDDARAAGNTSWSFETYQTQWKANARGVDINRNFDVKAPAGYEKEINVTAPAGSGYPGEKPGSEPETRAYMDFVSGLSNPVACISYHSLGQLIYWDCGQDYSGRIAAMKLAEIAKDQSGYMVYSVKSFTAASSDWCMLKKGIPAITIETGGGYSHPLSIKEFETIFEKCRNIYLAAALLY